VVVVVVRLSPSCQRLLREQLEKSGGVTGDLGRDH
jgi:hypothetical protein